jgi:aminoglycoside phosphotransferase (APT) family kinase protein
LLEWIPGVTLHDAACSPGSAELGTVARLVGRALGQIHSVPFERTGFLAGPTLTLVEPFDAGSAGLVRFAESCLFAQGGAERLGLDLAKSTFEWLRTAASRLDDGECTPCLVHGDYGATNLLVRETGDDIAVLDWEFACAGIPAFDFGNLLRDPLRGMVGFTRELSAGYRETGGELEQGWEKRAALSDLFACFQFLGRSAEHAERLPGIRRRVQQIRSEVEA